MAGLRERANIYKIDYGSDSPAGGAMITGSLQYAGVMSQMDAVMPSQLLLQQGYETQTTWTALIVPGTLDIQVGYEYEPIAPFNHPEYGNRFRIVGVRKSSNLPYNPNNYMTLSLVRSKYAHQQQ